MIEFTLDEYEETSPPPKKDPPKNYVGFPKEYLPTRERYPVPAVPFQEHPTIGKDLVNLKIYVSKDYFEVRVRDLFTNLDIKHRKGDSHRWIRGPNLSFWPQMLNFTLWCSTGGCGVAENMMNDDQAGSFFRFHVAFTTRRLLYELKAILPGDKMFDPVDVSYDKVALERIRNEFTPSTQDFRFTYGSNGGLGDIYVNGKRTHTDWGHEPTEDEKAFDERMNQWPGGTYKFGGTPPHLPMDYLYNPESKYQWKHFVPQKGKRLTPAGLARINRSIEAFVYCILGAQMNTRSPILGKSGSARETQQEFLTLFESTIIENDISKSIQRYQLAIQNAKVQLNYALAPECWLLPSDLVVNLGSVPGYNNKLQRATHSMKFGINDINKDLIQNTRHSMEDTKVELPHRTKTHKSVDPAKPVLPPRLMSPPKTHEINLILISACAAGLAWYLF